MDRKHDNVNSVKFQSNGEGKHTFQVGSSLGLKLCQIPVSLADPLHDQEYALPEKYSRTARECRDEIRQQYDH